MTEQQTTTAPTVRPADQVVLVLSHADAQTLGAIFESAQRGREDFEYLVSHDGGDYEPEDIEATRESHQKELALQDQLNLALLRQTGAPIEYLVRNRVPHLPYSRCSTMDEAEHVKAGKLDPAQWSIEATYVPTAFPRVFLDLNTSLLPEVEMQAIATAPTRVIEHEFGAWVYVPALTAADEDPLDDNHDDDWEDFPNLRPVLIEARELGAWWINLDGDGYDLIAGLPTFNW